jgi:hypothetical protein
MPDEAPDVVRLTLPPDPDLRGVVEVAIAVLARRLALDDRGVRAARAAAGQAFEAVGAGSDGEPVEVVLSIDRQEVAAVLRAGAVERRVSAPKPPPDPPR